MAARIGADLRAHARAGVESAPMPADCIYVFGACQLDPRARTLLRDGQPVDLRRRQFDVLLLLVERAGQVVSKDDLLKAGWRDVLVTDSSVEKLIFDIRQILTPGQPNAAIETEPRKGYRFVLLVTRVDRNPVEFDFAAVLAPHQAWADGLAALESLEIEQVTRAHSLFMEMAGRHAREARFHIGLALTSALLAQDARAGAGEDHNLLSTAETHGRCACELNPPLAECWATLGFVLKRRGKWAEALAALDRAVTLEPDNWRHQARLADASWGEARLRGARRALSQCPHLALARWLTATVYIARDGGVQADAELDAGIAVAATEAAVGARYAVVGLHMLKGLLALDRGDVDEADTHFDRELAQPRNHVYGRDCAATSWCGKAVCAFERGDFAAAEQALDRALARVPMHLMTHVAFAVLLNRSTPVTDAAAGASAKANDLGRLSPFDRAYARAAIAAATGEAAAADAILAPALAAAPPGPTGWMLPIDPLLRMSRNRSAWHATLSTLHLRAR